MKAEFDFERGRSIVWLASYPKSGNTWVRALLTAYLDGGGELNLNALVGKSRLLDRQMLDDMAGIDSALLSPRDLIPYQAMQIRSLSASAREPVYIKTHSAYLSGEGGCALFPAEATAGAIYIVRNPLDIVLSYAHHEGKDFDAIIAMMSDETAMLDHWPSRRSSNIPQLVSSWSNNVASWISDAPFPVHLVRYEDILRTPSLEFERILDFLGMTVATDRVAQAIDRASFASLATAERKSGFAEKPSSARSFFRQGEAGVGLSVLDVEQLRKILQDSEAIMTRVDYGASEAQSQWSNKV